MQTMAAMRWLAKAVFAGLVLLAAGRLATAWIGTGLQQPAATARDGSLIAFNRYVHEPVPEVVLAGSSVMWRLKEEYFALASTRNLALAGGSPVTGLAVVAGQRRLPATVVVETTILARLADEGLIARFSGGGSDPLFLRPVRTAVAAYENWSHAPPDPKRIRTELDALLAKPPSGFDNRIYVARAVAEGNAADPSAEVRANVERIGRLIEAIERRGSRVLLVELPISPEVSETRAARATRQIVRGAFPAGERWLAIAPPQAELRWADGVHLDERSALLVARALEQALAARRRN